MCKVYHESINISTSKKFELIDITSKVEEIIYRSGIKNGICMVFVPHATAAIIANEHEPGLINDIITFVKEFTQVSRDWEHNLIDDNAHAHIGSAFISPHRLFPVVNKRIFRGTWQNIFLLEMDGPRSSRVVYVTVIGE
ncbi:MAG: secondary thiamine-phosphate synthase enzyme YjbQ [Ignisphaera sp.]|uniref:YjbQ family protein n=1 Tax=Ignisphaera aggregans TaxID=334771 RepID=A0A7C4NP12_9CREN